MGFRTSVALLLSLSACATSAPSRRESVTPDLRFANLERAAALPWMDDGRCAVREASQPWAVLVERCFQALDHDRIRPTDPAGRCGIAFAEVAPETEAAGALAIEACVVAAPEVAAVGVIVIGAVVVGVAIKEALDSYEPRSPPSVTPVPATKPVPQDPSTKREPSRNPVLKTNHRLDIVVTGCPR